MRDPKRIGKIVYNLLQYWIRNPDLRLGQIISNIAGDRGHNVRVSMHGAGWTVADPFYMEDEEVIAWLEEHETYK